MFFYKIPIFLYLIFSVFILFVALPGMGAGDSDQPLTQQGFLVGVVTNVIGTGLQAEWRVLPVLGFRATGLWFYGPGFGYYTNVAFVAKGEYVLCLMAGPVFHIPTAIRDVEALVIFGVEYSRYRWSLDRWRRHGYINDFTGGTGIGVHYRLHRHAGIELMLWANNDYRITSFLGRKTRRGRWLLVLPVLAVNSLF